MMDRTRDAGIALLVLSTALARPDLGPAEGRVALALVAGLILMAAGRLRRRETAAWERGIFLASVLFLLTRPFAAPQVSGPLPARALTVLGVALVLWIHMNVQSVSGRWTWRFSRLDSSVLLGCGFVVLSSLGTLWARGDPGRVVPHVLLQGMAVTVGVAYLYVTRWRPGRPTFVGLVLLLVVLLMVSLWGTREPSGAAPGNAPATEPGWGTLSARGPWGGTPQGP